MNKMGLVKLVHTNAMVSMDMKCLLHDSITNVKFIGGTIAQLVELLSHNARHPGSTLTSDAFCVQCALVSHHIPKMAFVKFPFCEW